MKTIDVCGVCNGLVDIFADISERELIDLGYEKGTMRLVEVAEQRDLLDRVGSQNPVMRSGGSVANSLITVAQLGGAGALFCHLGDDEYGRFFRDECSNLGVRIPVPLAKGHSTGTCVALLTPDAERTMRTSLGASVSLAADHITGDVISASRWLFVEGYVFSNSDGGRAAISEAIKVARGADTKVAITCSEAWVVNAFGGPLQEALEHAHLVFANEEESSALSGSPDILTSGRKLKDRFPHVVLTAGPRGAYIWWEGEELHVPAFPCQPRDLTGAGDTFAGSFLYGITRGLTPSDAAHRAGYLARHVIEQVGARLTGDVKSMWNQANQ
jgi:sugar/nucleoside kinase (ribokinase family)